jgi:GTP-binding protein
MSTLSSTRRTDLRNVAIVAHVDHGKTTLVDAMLHQAGAFTAHQAEGVAERVMDSGDLEREKGITILAKNTAVHYRGPSAQELANGDMTINIIDTPGHADFGGEVERGLSMVDGIVLLVDASEGPLPQTRFVLRKALNADMPVILVVNKTDRGDARIDEVVDETYELFMDLLDENHSQDALDFPVVFASGKAGIASLKKPENGTLPTGSDLEPLFRTILENIPAPEYVEGAPLQAHVTNLDASPFLGRLALLRIKQGNLKKGQQVAWMRRDGEVKNVKVTELLITEGLERKPGETAGPGDIVAVAGIPEITIGETLADPENPVALPLIHVDEPAISMTIGTNTSPLVGKGGKGHKVTARLVKDRLDAELVGNVSLRVLPTERPDAWEVQGRGELALAILVEQMRREGYELTVGKPQVVTREVDGKLHEPYERLTIDAPEEFLGTITELLANRKGRMEGMTNHGTGWVRMDFVVPARGLIGFRTDFLTETRGTGIAHHISEGYHPWAGEIRSRASGSLVADRTGVATAYAMTSLQERGILFVEPATEVYEGMIVGENSRADDMDVNITKEKQQTNIRSATSDNFEKLIPPRRLSLEQCLEFCREDECVEITPETVRIRKVVLDQNERGKMASRARKGTR